MKESPIEPKSAKTWQKTQYANLIRYVPSGIYFARVRIKGKLVQRSLKTKVLSTAKLLLDDFSKKHREASEASGRVASGKMRVSDCQKVYLQEVDGNPAYKPRTKAYHGERLTALKKSWPELFDLNVRKITKADCTAWAAKFREQSSPVAFNHTLGTLRRLFEIGVEAGVRFDNPAKDIAREKEPPKKPRIPEPAEFEQLVQTVQDSGSGFASRCADLVRFLAFGGFRIMEARNVRWEDCDFAKGRICVKGDPETGTKGSGEERFVPMIPEMRVLLERLRSERPHEAASEGVMQVHECLKALATACSKLGIPKLTHHDLRHLFTTRCIESGVDIPTVARWLGHKDGGALLMRVYGHLRDTHSAGMAAKVSFMQPQNIVPMAQEAANG